MMLSGGLLAMSSGAVWGLVLVGGLGLLVFALWRLKMDREVLTWSVADGTVKRAWLTQSYGGNGVVVVSVIIAYGYRVAGCEYAGKGAMPELKSDGWRTELPSVGDAVEVFYDPARPQRSVLCRGDNTASLFVMLAALAVMALAVGMMLLGGGE